MLRHALLPFALALAGAAALAHGPAGAESLTLDAALRRARSAHPALAVAHLDTRAAAARARDAARRPVPALSAEVEDLGGRDGADGIQATLALARTFELGGDRDARRGSADAVTALAGASAAALERQLAAATTTAFLDAWRAQQRVALERAAGLQADEAVRAAEDRLRAGAAPASERARAQGFAALRALERGRAERALAAARRALAALWGAEALDADSLALAAPPPLALPPAAAAGQSLAAHPERRRAEAEAGAAAWRVREARAARTVDLEASAGLRHLPEDRGVGLVVAVTLPLGSRLDGAVEAAGVEHEAARLRAATAERALARELDEALAALAAADTAWRLADGPLALAADEALRSVTAAYRAGRMAYSEIAESQRSRLEAETMRIDALADVWRARAAVERLTGTPLDAAGEGR